MPLDSAAGAPDRMFKENLIFPVLSTPWKIYLLITIGTGTVRFGVLRRSLPSISRVSVTKYLTELERDGFITTVVGKGSFVRAADTRLVREEKLKQIEELLTRAISVARASAIGRQEIEEMIEIIYQEE